MWGEATAPKRWCSWVIRVLLFCFVLLVALLSFQQLAEFTAQLPSRRSGFDRSAWYFSSSVSGIGLAAIFQFLPLIAAAWFAYAVTATRTKRRAVLLLLATMTCLMGWFFAGSIAHVLWVETGAFVGGALSLMRLAYWMLSAVMILSISIVLIVGLALIAIITFGRLPRSRPQLTQAFQLSLETLCTFWIVTCSGFLLIHLLELKLA